jgi:Flp pilus assembly pilin Flp
LKVPHQLALRADSGQAMTEYALVTALILGLLVGAGWTVLPDFVGALQRYLDGFYVLLNLPIP